MHSLTPSEVNFVYNSLFYTFAIGFGFFLVAMALITFFFGLNIKDVAAKSKFFIGLLVFSLLTPMLVGQFYGSVKYSQASTDVKVSDVIIKKLDEKNSLVTYKTSEPVYSYLLYKDKEDGKEFPVMPVEDYQKKAEHTFVVNGVGAKGGTATIVINSKNYLLDGQPLEVK